MRAALAAAEKIWVKHGREEGITITAGLDGVHSAGSWHYYGCAIDIRNHYFTDEEKQTTYLELKKALSEYDIIKHATHIHIEPGNPLARKWGLLL